MCLKTNRYSLRFHRGGSSSCNGLFCELALVLASSFSTALSTSVQDLFAILVHLQLDNAHLGGMDSNVNRCTIGLFTLDAFNVNTEFLAGTLDNLANLLAFVVTTYNLNFVVFANGDILDSVFRAEIFGQWSSHQLPSDVRWSSEMALALFLGRR